MKNKSVFAKIIFMFAVALAFSLFVLVSFHDVQGAGIGSSEQLNYMIDFKPGLQRTFPYFVNANAPNVMDYNIVIEGSLAQYFTLSNNLFKNIFPGQTRSFSATLKFPNEKPPAGEHATSICAEDAEAGGGGGISARTRACSIITVRVLYQEKYLRIEGFNAPNADAGDILELQITVKSWTESYINSVKATIDIFGPSERGFDKKIVTLQTDEKPLASNEQLTLSASLDTKNFESGEYNAVATAYYDGNNATASTKFRVGILAVKVVNYTKEIVRNKINKFNVDVESRWNSLIENVYADVKIEDGKNETLKTPAINLKAWETATLVTYYDAADRKAQYYDGKIILYFAGNSTEQDIKVKVLINPEEIRRLMIYMGITAIVVVLIVVIVLISLKKPTGKNAEKKKRQKRK